MSKNLEKKNIILGLLSVSKENAIRAAGEKLLEGGYIKGSYIESMLEREKGMSTYMGMGVAIPHGLSESQKDIKESGIVILQYPNGIKFNNDIAYLVIGLAGKGKDHLEMLSNIAINLDDEVIEKLKISKDKQDFIEAFAE